MPLVFDPQDPATRADPFPLFAQLREAEPVHWSPVLKSWVLTRYDDVRRAAMTSDLSPDRLTPFFDSLPGEQRGQMAELIRYLTLWLVFRDPPEHTRLRRLMNKVFTPSALARLRPAIEDMTRLLIDDLEQRDSADLIRDLANPLPAYVIMAMLGVPRTDLANMKAWSDDMVAFIGSARGVKDKYLRAERGAREMSGYFRDLIAHRRAAPQDDIITSLITARDEDDGLTEDELVATCMLLLFAGHETTANLIGNGILALLRHPDQLALLRRQPELIDSAVEEILRYDGPSGALARVVATPHVLHGVELAQGDRVFAMLNAANRDPRAFDAPDRFDITRSPNRHLTFGVGTHFCLGGPLARIEGQVAIGEAIRRLPHLALAADTLPWIDALIMRGVTALPVSLVGPSVELSKARGAPSPGHSNRRSRRLEPWTGLAPGPAKD